MPTNAPSSATDPTRATPANWRTAPFSRWAFHHVNDILPTAVIAAEPGRALELPTSSLALDDFRLGLPDGSTLSLDAFLDATTTDSLVILHDGRVVFERHDHGNGPDTPHIFMSVTKAMMGLLAGALQQRGALDIDALVSSLVPEIDKTAYRGATIRHLLDMRTGAVLDAGQTQAYEAVLRGDAPQAGAPSDIHGALQTLTSAQSDHGRPFSYISANTDLLGWAMERATGQSLAALFSELLWKPMGAEHDALIIVDREGSPWCSGGFCATARDFARVGQLLLNDGRRGGSEILSKAWIDDLYDNGDRRAWREGEWGALFAAISPNMSYRSGWYTIDDDPKLLFAMGTHGQNLFVDRANQLVIAKLSSQDRMDIRAVGLTHMAVAELRLCVLGEER